uniref:Uncharacterized protein n=1 Tax=Glossina pallidipes TaxID=7398 RepID=A0A1B0A450_GLOPL
MINYINSFTESKPHYCQDNTRDRFKDTVVIVKSVDNLELSYGLRFAISNHLNKLLYPPTNVEVCSSTGLSHTAGFPSGLNEIEKFAREKKNFECERKLDERPRETIIYSVSFGHLPHICTLDKNLHTFS